MRCANKESLLFDLALPLFTLECGERLEQHIVRGWWWGPRDEVSLLERAACLLPLAERDSLGSPVSRTPEAIEGLCGQTASKSGRSIVADKVPTILVVHALTGDMRVGGSGGWWSEVVGDGRPLDPNLSRILCFNNLGSCYGTSGPEAWAFNPKTRSGSLSTWDQARSILLALDHLGIATVDAAIGGSVGGAILLCLAALAPERFKKIVPIATAERASAWVVAWNHIARQIILNDPGYPQDSAGGLGVARQLAHLSYRAESGLEQRHGRGQILEHRPGADGRSPFELPYRVQDYLNVQGQKLTDRFRASSYIALLDAIDNHDLARAPRMIDSPEALALMEGSLEQERDGFDLASPCDSWGLSRISAEVVAASVDSDQLFYPEHTTSLCLKMRALGKKATSCIIESVHGHDGFLMEFDQIDRFLRTALDHSEPTQYDSHLGQSNQTTGP